MRLRTPVPHCYCLHIVSPYVCTWRHTIPCIPIIPFQPEGPATAVPVPAPCQPGAAGMEAVKWVTTPQRTRSRLAGRKEVGPDRPSLMSGSLSLCRI